MAWKKSHAIISFACAETLGDTSDAPQRAAIIECLIAGMILTRYIYRLDPAASPPAPAFEAAFASSLQHAITGPLQAMTLDRSENHER